MYLISKGEFKMKDEYEEYFDSLEEDEEVLSYEEYKECTK